MRTNSHKPEAQARGPADNSGHSRRCFLCAATLAVCLPRVSTGDEKADPDCPRCGGVGRVPMTDAKPFVWLQGTPLPKPDAIRRRTILPRLPVGGRSAHAGGRSQTANRRGPRKTQTVGRANRLEAGLRRHAPRHGAYAAHHGPGSPGGHGAGIAPAAPQEHHRLTAPGHHPARHAGADAALGKNSLGQIPQSDGRALHAPSSSARIVGHRRAAQRLRPLCHRAHVRDAANHPRTAAPLRCRVHRRPPAAQSGHRTGAPRSGWPRVLPRTATTPSTKSIAGTPCTMSSRFPWAIGWPTPASWPPTASSDPGKADADSASCAIGTPATTCRRWPWPRSCSNPIRRNFSIFSSGSKAAIRKIAALEDAYRVTLDELEQRDIALDRITVALTLRVR